MARAMRRAEAMLPRGGPGLFALALLAILYAGSSSARADFTQAAHSVAGLSTPSLSVAPQAAPKQVVETIRRMPRTHAVRTTDTQFAIAPGKPAISAEIVGQISLAAASSRMIEARESSAAARAPPQTTYIL